MRPPDEYTTRELAIFISNMEKALILQAKEYERRLDALNGEYKRDASRQANFVTLDKFETYSKAEQEKIDAALIRTNEKFDDYVKRYELRQREIDAQLDQQKGAAATIKAAVELQARKTSRNLAGASLALAVFIALANYLSTHG